MRERARAREERTIKSEKERQKGVGNERGGTLERETPRGGGAGVRGAGGEVGGSGGDARASPETSGEILFFPYSALGECDILHSASLAIVFGLVFPAKFPALWATEHTHVRVREGCATRALTSLVCLKFTHLQAQRGSS